jgi:hypothetical protein
MAAFFRSVYQAFRNLATPPKKTEGTFEQVLDANSNIEQQNADAKDIKRKAPRDYAEEVQLFYTILMRNYQKLGVDRLGRSNDKLFDGFGRAIYNAITVSVSKIGEEEAINAFRISAQILKLEERLKSKAVEDIEKEIKNELLYLK